MKTCSPARFFVVTYSGEENKMNLIFLNAVAGCDVLLADLQGTFEARLAPLNSYSYSNIMFINSDVWSRGKQSEADYTQQATGG